MTQTIAIACHKGGVGKTTTAASVGGILANRGYKTLLIDLDAQKNLSGTFASEPYPRTMAEAFDQGRDIPQMEIRKNLFLAPSSDDLSMMDVVMGYKRKTGREYLLAELLGPVRNRYDFIIIDSPAQLGLATVNALAAADHVLVPINADAYSMGGLGQLMELIGGVHKYNNPRLDVAGIFLTRYNGRRIVDRKVKESVLKEYGDVVLNTVIRENSALVQAPLLRMDITTYDASSNGAKDYAELCDELVKRLKTKR